MKQRVLCGLLLLGGLSIALASTPIDLRHTIKPAHFSKAGKGSWVSPSIKPQIPFNELIYDWNIRLPRGQGFRLYLQVEFGSNDFSPWLYGGFWGDVPLSGKRKNPTFDRGLVDEDTLKLSTHARAYRFKIVDEGSERLTMRPLLHVIATETNATPELAERFGEKHPASDRFPLLNLPFRAQADTCGNPLKDRCQSAAVATAMQYFGRSIPLERIICYTTDPEYESFGIWPRTINAAVEHGFEAYIDRFRTWDSVRRTVAENKVILCSITMPANDDYLSPPYPKIGGHIVALCGVTADGRVIVTDSASIAQPAADESKHLQWLAADFEKIWMRNKGGVGMVICPPKNAPQLLLNALPPFPRPWPKR